MIEKIAVTVLATAALTGAGAIYAATGHADPVTGSAGIPAEIPIGSGSAETLLAGSAATPAAAETRAIDLATDHMLHARLLLVGADRPDAVPLAHAVCGILRADPNIVGKTAALDHLNTADVPDGFVEGWTLGTSVDLYCPDLVHAIQ